MSGSSTASRHRTCAASSPTPPRARAALRYGLSAFVIARETDALAQEELERAFALKQQDAPLLQRQAQNIDPNAVMFQTFARNPHIGSNGGTAAGLVGSYDTVAARIRQFHDLGIETFMLQFQPFEAEMRRFAHEVRPRVDRLGATARPVAVPAYQAGI